MPWPIRLLNWSITLEIPNKSRMAQQLLHECSTLNANYTHDRRSGVGVPA
jgi:hypothetical protein